MRKPIDNTPRLPARSRLCAFVLLALSGVLTAQSARSSSASGIEILRRKSVDGSQVAVVRLNPTRFSVQVWDLFGAVQLHRSTPYSSYDLQDIVRTFKPRAAINGGFTSSYSLPVPAGLLIRRNKIVAPLNTKSSTQSGVLCVKGAMITIINKKSVSFGDCEYALQSGPLLIEKGGKIGVFAAEEKSKPNYRSVVAIDSKQRLLFVQSSPTSLYSLSKFLARDESEGGLGCTVALNLSGDVESGLFVQSSREEKPLIVGHADTPIASAIIVLDRR